MAGSTPLVLVQFDETVPGPDGRSYVVSACGRVMDDGTGRWEGWLEFTPTDGGAAFRSGQETTQPNVTDLRYWASGLSLAYLDGALRRVLSPPVVRTERRVDATPAYEGPAPHRTIARTSGRGGVAPRAVLDPFAVYLQGEDVLRQELSALDAGHLRNILGGYDLAPHVDIRALSEPELVALIVQRVKGEMSARSGEQGLGSTG